jgi:hypothetical protein
VHGSATGFNVEGVGFGAVRFMVWGLVFGLMG